MTITRRDSNFLNAPTIVPENATKLINNFESSIDENILNIFKAIVRDLEEYKKSMAGITRRFDRMLFIYNQPNQKQTDVQEAMRMDKYGNFAFGTEYPLWPFCKIDVNGPLYAIPQYCVFAKTTVDLAGAGLYAWNSTVYNPRTDIYQLIAANTRIQINVPGTYYISALVTVQDTVALTGDSINWRLRKNATNIVAYGNGLMNDDFAQGWLHKQVEISKGDIIDVNLLAPATSAKYGEATGTATWIMITKVN